MTDPIIEDFVASMRQRMDGLNLSGNPLYERKFDFEKKSLYNYRDHPKSDKEEDRDYYKRLIAEMESWRNGGWESNESGSLFLFLLGASTLDPVAHRLQYQVNVLTGGECPDIDTDFTPEVCAALKEKHLPSLFEPKNVCLIGAYGTFKTRQTIVDVAKACGVDQEDAYVVTREMDITEKHDMKGDDGGDAEADKKKQLLDEMDWDVLEKTYPNLKDFLDKHSVDDGRGGKRYPIREHSKVLRNQIRSFGQHAGGVIIPSADLLNYIPIAKAGKNMVSAWVEGMAGHELIKNGLVKFDILGLRHLNIVKDCIQLINESRGINLTRSMIPLEDHTALRASTKGDMVGIFQFDSVQTLPILQRIGLDTFKDVIAGTAMIRPGPKDAGMHDLYAEVKNGFVPNEHPVYLETLKDSRGTILYQESVMALARNLAGFSMEEANLVRKAMGKKIDKIMKELEPRFVKQSMELNGLTKEKAEEIWNNMAKHSGYSFNISHGATYSCITSSELFLRHHFPAEFWCASINNYESGKKNREKVSYVHVYINQARKAKIKVLNASINSSKGKFSLEEDAESAGGWSIRFGLENVRYVASSAKDIMESRPYVSMDDFYTRINKTRVNKKVVESLIDAGAFDCLYDEISGISGKRATAYRDYYTARGEMGDVKVSSTVLDMENWLQHRWEEREAVAALLSLTADPLRYKIEAVIEKRKANIEAAKLSKKPQRTVDKTPWHTIEDLHRNSDSRKWVVLRLDSWSKTTSKTGNPMLVVKASDDMDEVQFYVFKAGIAGFESLFKPGNRAVIPIKSFPKDDEGGDKSTYFQDDDFGKLLGQQVELM